MNQTDPYHTVVFRLIESFTPHIRCIFQQNSYFPNETNPQNPEIDNDEIFKIFPRKINNYSSMIRTILKIINCSPSFFLNDISNMFLQLVQNKACLIMSIFENSCKKVEGVTPDFCFCFSIIFLTDLISQILIKYEKNGFTDQNVQQLIECGINLIKKFDKIPLKTSNKARLMVFNQWSVINSILSEKNFIELTTKFDSFFNSNEVNIINNTVHLLKFVRLDLNPSNSSDFLSKIMKIIENQEKLNESFLKSVFAILLTAPSENISPFYSLIESKKSNQESSLNFLICLMMLRIPEFRDKIDDFFEKEIFPNASISEKVESTIIAFLYYSNNCEIDPRSQFWEWGVYKRSPSISILCQEKRKKIDEIELNQNESISKFMKYFFYVSDFSVCPKLFCYVLVFLASIDFGNFLNSVLPKFLELESEDKRFITLLMTVPLINSSNFVQSCSHKIEQQELNRFNSLLREKVLKTLTCLQFDDKITAVSNNVNNASFSRMVDESDKQIYETLKNWNLTQFTEINVHHMKSEETVQELSLEVQLLRALPFIVMKLKMTKNDQKKEDEDDDEDKKEFFDSSSIFLNESIMHVLLKLTFSVNESVAHESLLICRRLATSGSRFIKVIIKHLLEHSPSSESLFICISIIKEAVKNQLSIFQKLNQNHESDKKSSVLFDSDVLYDIELVSIIAMTSYHPVTRQIAYNILAEVNELLHQKGIFSCISKMKPFIEKIVKRRLFTYSLTDKPSQDQGILPSGMIQMNTALCSHFFDIWSVFLSELINVIVEANYFPLLMRFKGDKLIPYVKERVPMISSFFLSSFFAPELVDSISHNYKCKMFSRCKRSNSYGNRNDSYLNSIQRDKQNNIEQSKNNDQQDQNNFRKSEKENQQNSNSQEQNDQITDIQTSKNEKENQQENNKSLNSQGQNNQVVKNETDNSQNSNSQEQNDQITDIQNTKSEKENNKSLNSQEPNNQVVKNETDNNQNLNSQNQNNQTTKNDIENNQNKNIQLQNNQSSNNETINSNNQTHKINNQIQPQNNQFQFSQEPKDKFPSIQTVHKNQINQQEPKDEFPSIKIPQKESTHNQHQNSQNKTNSTSKSKRYPLTYSNSTNTISYKILPSVPLNSLSSKSTRNINNENSINNNSPSLASSSSSTFHILTNVISLFLNSNSPSLAFTIILHSHVALYPSIFDIFSSILFTPSSSSPLQQRTTSPIKSKNIECNFSLISEATKTVAIALRNPSITPIFMIKHLMTHVLKFIAALQGFISNTSKINGPRVIKWTEKLESHVTSQKELARNYCIIISRLFSIVNSYKNKQDKKEKRIKKKKKNCKRKENSNEKEYDYIYVSSDNDEDIEDKNSEDDINDSFLYNEDNDNEYDYDYEYDYCDKRIEKEEEKEISNLIEENWPIPNREIVFRFLTNWSTTKSEELQDLREHAAAAISVIVRVGPLFSDNLLIDISLLRLFSSLEQDGTSILEPLLFNHIDLLFKNYIKACYTEQRNSGDLFFEALHSTFELVRKKYTDINNNTSNNASNSSSFFLQQKTNQAQKQKESPQNKKVTFNLNTNLSLSDFNFAFQEMIGSLLLLCLVYIRMNYPCAIQFLQSLAKIITASIYNRSGYSLGFNSSKRIEEILTNEKYLIQSIHIMFAFATETVIESGFSILSLTDLTVPQKEIIEAIRPWISNLRLLPKQRNCVPGIPSEFERFTPYQFLEVLMKTTEIIDDENFTTFASLWNELIKSPDHSELIPLFISKWDKPETNKKLLFQLIQTDAPSIVKRLALHCSFAYYYYEFTSNDNSFNAQYYYDKMWFLPLITEAFKNQNDELVQHIPTVVHFAFLFNDVIGTAHQLLEVLCQQFSINLKHYINSNNNEYKEYIEENNFSDNNSIFELSDDILIQVVREFSCILSQISEDYIQYWGKEALKWLFGCRSLRVARISLTIFNQIMRPIEPIVITGICKTVSFHVMNSSDDINNLTKLVGQAFVFYNAVFEKNEIFSFEFAVSFLDCKIFVDSCLKTAAQLFLKSLSSKETNTRAWQSIIGIVRPLLNKLEKDELNQKVIDLLIKTSSNKELMMIVAPIKIISPHLFTSSPYECFEDLLNDVSDIVMCKSLVHYATMIETASNALLNSIYQVSTQIVSKVVKNENNRASLFKIYKSALYNLCVCDCAIDFVSIIANIEPSVATKSVYEFYDWNRSLEDVSRSLVRLLSTSSENATIVPITDCSTIQSVSNLINTETIPKILPFVAQQDMLDGMKRVRRVIPQKKRRHSLKKSTLQQQNVQQVQQQQNQINQDQQQMLNEISWDFEPLWKPDKLLINSMEFNNESKTRNTMELQEFVFADSFN